MATARESTPVLSTNSCALSRVGVGVLIALQVVLLAAHLAKLRFHGNAAGMRQLCHLFGDLDVFSRIPRGNRRS